jgi:outer membrane receptor protein involved in Fe transport
VNNETTIRQHRFGGTAQATWRLAGLFGENALTVGFEGEAADADVRLTEQPGFVNARRTVVATGPPALATDVGTDGTAFGVYATDSLTPLDWLTLSASLRYDRATIDIDNHIDREAGGEHTFERVNPLFGVNVRAGKRLDFYGQYGESFRVPSAIELACANEDDPCPLPVAFADDPPLDEVKARTFEIGIRARPAAGTRASLALFHTRLEDDILFVASSRSEGFFQNVDETRRIGLEAGLDGAAGAADWFVSYSLTKATFEARAAFPSAAGENVARPGDELPGVPNHLVKAGLAARLPWAFRVGLDVQYVGGQFLRGDEANERGRLDGYVVTNARLTWSWKRLTVFARAENLFDAEYETFGAFGENALADEQIERFLSPGAPLGGWFGLRLDL